MAASTSRSSNEMGEKVLNYRSALVTGLPTPTDAFSSPKTSEIARIPSPVDNSPSVSFTPSHSEHSKGSMWLELVNRFKTAKSSTEFADLLKGPDVLFLWRTLLEIRTLFSARYTLEQVEKLFGIHAQDTPTKQQADLTRKNRWIELRSSCAQELGRDTQKQVDFKALTARMPSDMVRDLPELTHNLARYLNGAFHNPSSNSAVFFGMRYLVFQLGSFDPVTHPAKPRKNWDELVRVLAEFLKERQFTSGKEDLKLDFFKRHGSDYCE